MTKRATEAMILLLTAALIFTGYCVASHKPPFCFRCDAKGSMISNVSAWQDRGQ